MLLKCVVTKSLNLRRKNAPGSAASHTAPPSPFIWGNSMDKVGEPMNG